MKRRDALVGRDVEDVVQVSTGRNGSEQPFQRGPVPAADTRVHVEAGVAQGQVVGTTINIYGHLLPSIEAALPDGLTATFNEAQHPGRVATLR